MFQDLYKQSLDKNERQEIRRKKLLQLQKLKRLEDQDEHRFKEEETNQQHDRKERSKYKKYKNTKLENINLQLSEWLKEKPENMDDWILMPCPKGQRCIVVASRGETKMFSKNKKYCMTFSSLLPGGSSNSNYNDSCILDCVYNKDVDKFFVLDAIHYSIPLMDCEAEFRFFWLKSKFNELNDLQMEHRCDNLKSFELLETYDMSNEERVATALQRYPIWENNEPNLDGFLFYHKHSHYVCGTTPLVCWLFAFMLPDILEMPVSRFYEIPENYSKQNPLQYMDEFDMELKRKQFRKHKKRTDIADEPLCEEMNSTSMEELEVLEQSMEGSVL